MIVKNFEIEKFINKERFFLLYGENEGLKEDIILSISKNYPKESIFKYTEKEVLNNLDDFYNNILSQSFFDKKKLILINNISDKLKSEIEIILSKNISDVVLIFISNILEKKSKIRNLFEKEKSLICVPVYKDDNRTLSNITYSFFKSKKINVSTEAVNLIVSRSSEDRKNLKNELNKIENFIVGKKKIELEDLIKLTNLSENYSINKIVDLSLAKNTKQAINALNENIIAPEDVIIIIRSYLVKSKRLLKLSEQLENIKNIDQVISTAKPPIFWKDKDIVKKQISIWDKNNIRKLIKKISDIELLVKKNSNLSINILRDFIIEQSSKANN